MEKEQLNAGNDIRTKIKVLDKHISQMQASMIEGICKPKLQIHTLFWDCGTWKPITLMEGEPAVVIINMAIAKAEAQVKELEAEFAKI